MTLPTTKLGQTGLTVSRFVLGTMTFGLQSDEETSRQILDSAADAGINFLDTADVYPLGGGLATAGRTEEIIGRWLKGKREQFILATKCVGNVGPSPWDQGASRKHILDAIDASLRRLQTDYVDLYQLHSDDASTPLDETLEALDAIVKAGKVRYIGLSNFLAYRLSRALGRADVRNLTRFVSIQPRYNLLFREIERELLPLAKEEGLGVIPYNPLAGGLLTGKHNRADNPSDGTRFTLGTAAEIYQKRYWHDREFDTVEELRTVADAAGLSLTTLSLAWVLANPIITAPIIGASRPEQLIDSLRAIKVNLDDSLKQKLDDITAEYRKGDAVR
ncbi:alcohol dehydrogenase [[Phormidium ambiguum] IAM M-71]|uniref:Alcohol dehydrogenase n=1 Tax=[Phormidium ambiguum] IAM M-71 TaxID=454136 RepID=A0A1U7I9X7_9CYAN|nr:aldo/keto reductase [Phormidium ambiguum]OKH33254.1 alcohol dehydrogenase [Phormidium ambiguum IAM M-71]